MIQIVEKAPYKTGLHGEVAIFPVLEIPHVMCEKCLNDLTNVVSADLKTVFFIHSRSSFFVCEFEGKVLEKKIEEFRRIL